MSRTIYSDKSIKEEYSEEQLSQWLYDGLVGAIMGTGLTSVNPETYVFNPGNAQISAEQEKSGLQPPAEGKTQAPQPGTEQKNSAPEEAESTAVNTDPAQHTAVEQAVIDEYQAAVDDNLVNYIETVRDNKGAKIGRYSLKPVAERAAKDIMRLTGVDVSGNQTAIEARNVEHILKRHGENGTANHSMRDINDIARIQYVLDNYDTASYGGKTLAYQTVKPNGRPGQANTVVFSKAVNGTYYVVEAVPDTKKKTVFIVSAYMSNQKAGDVQTADADAWRFTSETKNAQSPAVEAKTSTNAIIAQSDENYHNNFRASLETGNAGERSGKGAPSGGAGTRSVSEGGTTAAADTAANTNPAAVARQQQYQTEIAAALRAGDYQRAITLFKEFGNPNLRTLNDLQTLKAFGDFAAAMGYDVSPEDISTDQILGAFEESYRNAIENQTRSDIIIPTEELPDRVLTRRKVSDRGTEIIDKATYHKLTNPVIKRGGEIKFADEEWMRYLKMRDATAAIIGDVIILMPDPTITDVLEEVYHFYQNRAGLNMQYSIEQHDIMNEIDAKEYLIRVADKYKIPQTEMEETRALLESYKTKMENLKKAGEWID